MKKLENHATLEAEVACLLILGEGLKARLVLSLIRGHLKNMDLVSSVDQGTFLAGAQVANPCDFRCSDQMYCNPGVQGAISGQVMGRAACDIANIQCMGSAKSGATNLPVCGGMDTMASWQFAEHRKELKVCYFPSISFLFTRS
jgi:hypothetical protein